jgi:hypothetical protein
VFSKQKAGKSFTRTVKGLKYGHLTRIPALLFGGHQFKEIHRKKFK